MRPEDILFAIDGAIGQCAVGKQLAEAMGQSALPIEGVYTSLMVLRALVEAEAEVPAAPDVTGECPHPADRVKRTDVGAGNWFLTCAACNSIIEQS